MTVPERARDVLDFWLGELDEDGLADEAHRRQWFTKDPAFDGAIHRRFGALHGELARGEHEDWLQTPRGRLAAIIVLDQFSRNLFRDDPAMIAQDAKALAIAETAIEGGDLDLLERHARYFLLMPFMHAESLEAQDRCVALFERERDAAPEHLKDRFDPKWALMHRDIVRRFGRFPHRNAMLGRESTPEEQAFLEEPGSSF